MLCTDEELYHRIQRSDGQALKLLFQKYYTSLCRFAYLYTKSVHNAEEAVSDVFLNLWLRRDAIQIHTSLKAYLFTAVKNQSLNYLRRDSYAMDDLDAIHTGAIASDLQADCLVVSTEAKNHIESLLNLLPAKRQMIFRMNRIDGLSYKEIAEILSISVHTVQNQMTAAIKFLSEKHPRRK